jgi:hypothetical protein
MNKKILISVVLLVIVVIGIFGLGLVQPVDKVLQSDSVLKTNSYIDNNSRFQINLPPDWTVADVSTTTTSSNTWFHNVSNEETRSSMTLVIGRFERTSGMEESIKEFGDAGFIEKMAKQMQSGINQYSAVSTSTVVINGISYYQTVGSYVGGKSNKKAVQYTYLTLTDSAYYLVGVDTYDEIWEKNKEAILESISTLKLL